jgi:hypothetical protein
MSKSTDVVVTRPKWIKRLGIAGGGGVLALILFYLFATSGMFVKSFVLPKLSAALNAKVTVEDAGVGLFSGVSLKKLNVEAGGETLVKTESASLKYSFFDLLSGRIRVSEFILDKPEVYVVVQKDGSSNLDPISEGMKSGEPAAEKPASGGNVDLSISNIALKGARFRFEQFTGTGLKNVFEADQVNIEIDRFGSGLEGNLKMSTRLLHESGPAALAPTDKLAAVVSAAFKFAFDPSLMPTSVVGSGELDVNEATGRLKDVLQLSGALAVDLTATELKNLALNFKRGDQSLGRIAVSGPFNPNTMAADLKIEVSEIGGSVLNLAGAPLGLAFGDTTVNTTHNVKVGEGARSVQASGSLRVGKLSVRQAGMVTPVVDLEMNYSGAFDQATESVDLGAFQMSGRDSGGEFLKAVLAQPFKISLKEGGAAQGGASAFDLALTNFDLARWGKLAGDQIESGLINLKVEARGTADARDLTVSIEESTRGLVAKAGTNRLSGIDTDASIKLKLVDLKKLAVELLRVEVGQSGARIVSVNSAGQVDLSNQDANLGVSVLVDIVAASRLMPLPDINLSGGALSFAGRLVSTNLTQSVNGKLSLTALSGAVAGNTLDRLGLATSIVATRSANGTLRLGELNGLLQYAGESAGSLALSGDFDPAQVKGGIKAALNGVNQHLLKPFLEPSLGGAQLASVQIDLSADAIVAGAADFSMKGNASVSNLVLRDPLRRFPETPLALHTAFDAKFANGSDGLKLKLPLLRGAVKVAGQDGGSFDVTADFDAKKAVGQFQLKVDGINEQLIAPFAAGALGDKTLKSIAINANAGGVIDLSRSTSIKGSFSVTNLVVLDPAGKIPASPLAVTLGIDAGMSGKVLDLRSLELALAPTERARNVLMTRGKIDFSDTNAIAATVSVTSDAIDLTQYYDLLTAGQAKAEPSVTPAATSPPAVDLNEEPPPVTLPVKNSKIDVRIAKLHLREIEIADLAITTGVDRQIIGINPLKMSINGGPVNGSVNLNLGLPGFQYDIRLVVDHVPIRPAIQSFSPTVGAASRGDLVANIFVKGAGQTGRNLKEHLTGNIGFYLTNAMLTIMPEQSATASPGTGIGAAFKSVGKEFASGGLKSIATVLGIPDLTSSPLTHVATQVEMGRGAILLKYADVKSDMFMVHAEGTIPIADVLTNSPLSVPVDMWLSKKAASRLTLGGGSEPFTQLPRFVEMRGTLGAPETYVNKAALGTVLLGGAAGLLKGVGGDVGKTAESILKQGGGEVGTVLKGIGGLFGGGAPKNDAAKTNAPPSKNPFQLFKLNP